MNPMRGFESGRNAGRGAGRAGPSVLSHRILTFQRAARGLLRRWPGVLALPGLLLAAAPFADVQLTTSVDKLAQVASADGETQTLLLDASRVRPGELLRYAIEFTNTGNEYIGPDIIVITNPIPEAAEYLEGTAVGDDTEIVFSVDKGISFGAPEDLIVDEGGVRLPAAPRHYTTIRWTFGGVLGPGESGSVGFDVVLQAEALTDEPPAG